MGLSFAGPGAPRTGRAAAETDWRALGLGALIAVILVTLGVVGMTVTAAAPVWSYLVEPFSLLLIPGHVMAAQIPMPPLYVIRLGLVCSVAFWTFAVAALIRAWWPGTRPRRQVGSR